MSRVQILNREDHSLIIPILNSAGRKTEVFVQPKSRVTMEEGATIDSNWMLLNKKSIVTRTLGD